MKPTSLWEIAEWCDSESKRLNFAKIGPTAKHTARTLLDVIRLTVAQRADDIERGEPPRALPDLVHELEARLK